jgi:recombination protein RecT
MKMAETTALAPAAKNRAIAALTNERVISAIKSVATKHMTAERIVKLVVGEFSRNPTLADCDPKSIVLCALAFSQLGLEPGGLLGHAYMIPRKNKHNNNRLEANFQLGYKGKIALNFRSGMFEFIHADVVYRDDRFEYEYGSSAFLRHVPNADSENHKDSDVVAAYAIAHLKGATRPIFRVVTRKQLNEARRKSQTPNFGPWVDHFPQMCCKTAVHRLETYLPMSTEMETAHALEERSEEGELSFADFGEIGVEDAIVTPVPEANGGSKGLREKLNVGEPTA